MDKRIKYKLVLDVEACPIDRTIKKCDPHNSLVYDVGFAIVDKKGRVYEQGSFIVWEVFFGLADDKMRSAYYANKIPNYLQNTFYKKHTIAKWDDIALYIRQIITDYDIKKVYAYNAYYDYTALNTTTKFLNGKYMLPYNVQWCDIMKMAQSTICKQKGYKRFCDSNNLLTATGRIKATAEAVYSYIIYNADFAEKHTGLEDVYIELAIMAKCFAQHKKMREKLFEKSKKNA